MKLATNLNLTLLNKTDGDITTDFSGELKFNFQIEKKMVKTTKNIYVLVMSLQNLN